MYQIYCSIMGKNRSGIIVNTVKIVTAFGDDNRTAGNSI